MAPEYEYVNTENKKICPVEEIASIITEAKKQGEKVGLITGCFDILHKGHIDLFRQAKQNVDILVVGIDRDETARLKGSQRPVNDIASRCEALAELMSVDLVFPMPFTLQEYTSSVENIALFEDLTKKIKPDCLITNPISDDFWEEKFDRAKKLGIDFIGLSSPRPTSSTSIAEKIQKEF
ncbi:hypothetical protein A2W13_01030 [Candidatus Woesebacteria bacterium RBG_16_36_11]|uniref:Cytidyltransferase-like domain-containing protein n=3 Tax=Candidatus Woeseibacteriota TaxID=1752722 RepID=A0A1F7XB07_9BACT|nr:MAG: hypothetical protein A2Z67_03035 [Candidatus Woesebacteria bacterium RBG_13_36_22]OGM12214.1 MAG: hypothetical protein A2W13_01030 [Candidatus Woesebacteria bacterium RBG_16_36_11]OGM16187.1 MAG: hypothetical protein A2V55_01490 [Candidatus Woesebacteria bacterium RBG_19FT_COMBO_37_29]